MLTKEQVIQISEKYLKKKYTIFNKNLFVLEEFSEGSKYKMEGKDQWALFDYHLTWVEFLDNTEKHEDRNIIKIKINAKTGNVYFVDLKHHKPLNKTLSNQTLKKLEIAKKVLQDFLKTEIKNRKLKLSGYIAYPISIESHPVYRKTFFFQNEFGKFYVPLDYKCVSDFVFNPIQYEEKPLTDEEAIQIVNKFLKTHYFNFTKRNFEIRSWKPENSDLIHFDFEEKSGKGEVSIFENYIRIMVDKKTHSIESYHSSDLWIRRIKSVKISQEQATKIFKKRFLKAKSPEARLRENFNSQTKTTTTVWYIYDEHNSDKIENKFCFGTYLEIDADSGKLLKIGGFECK